MDYPSETAANPEASAGIIVSLTLCVADDERSLVAVVPAKQPNLTSLNTVQLKNMLREQGYADWHVLEPAMHEVCNALGKSEDEKRIIIAECLDGEVKVTVSADAQEAYLSITPPQGGKPVSEAQVLTALSEAGVSYGIDRSAIDVNARDVITIARGSPAQDGEDSRFESLIAEVQDKRPTINDDGRVDYFEIGSLITVSEGDSLMRRFPPTPGNNGTDVYGKVVMAKPGKQLEFTTRMKGAKIDDRDRDLIIATNGGQPEIIERGMQVLPVINIANADLTTGNINFDGTVNIKGDVMEGIKIYATGDVLISGMSEGADIQADGNIVIQKGVIGRGKAYGEDGTAGQGAARLKCGGSIEARFIENAFVEAGKDVTVSELISHSDVTASNHVKVGKKGSKKAHIRGGRIRATVSVEAQIIGSPASIKTEIEVGNDPELRQRLNHVTQQYAEAESDYQKLSTLVSRLRNQNDAKSKATLVKALNSLKETIARMNALRKEKTSLSKRNELSDSAMVIVGKHAYPGVKISIAEQNHVVKRMTEAGKFVLKDGAIQLEYD